MKDLKNRVVVEKTDTGVRVTVPDLSGGTCVIEHTGAKAADVLKRAAAAGVLKKS